MTATNTMNLDTMNALMQGFEDLSGSVAVSLRARLCADIRDKWTAELVTACSPGFLLQLSHQAVVYTGLECTDIIKAAVNKAAILLDFIMQFPLIGSDGDDAGASVIKVGEETRA